MIKSYKFTLLLQQSKIFNKNTIKEEKILIFTSLFQLKNLNQLPNYL